MDISDNAEPPSREGFRNMMLVGLLAFPVLRRLPMASPRMSQ